MFNAKNLFFSLALSSLFIASTQSAVAMIGGEVQEGATTSTSLAVVQPSVVIQPTLESLKAKIAAQPDLNNIYEPWKDIVEDSNKPRHSIYVAYANKMLEPENVARLKKNDLNIHLKYKEFHQSNRDILSRAVNKEDIFFIASHAADIFIGNQLDANTESGIVGSILNSGKSRKEITKICASIKSLVNEMTNGYDQLHVITAAIGTSCPVDEIAQISGAILGLYRELKGWNIYRLGWMIAKNVFESGNSFAEIRQQIDAVIFLTGLLDKGSEPFNGQSIPYAVFTSKLSINEQLQMVEVVQSLLMQNMDNEDRIDIIKAAYTSQVSFEKKIKLQDIIPSLLKENMDSEYKAKVIKAALQSSRPIEEMLQIKAVLEPFFISWMKDGRIGWCEATIIAAVIESSRTLEELSQLAAIWPKLTHHRYLRDQAICIASVIECKKPFSEFRRS